jgi:molybdopterin-synthase adenylyltransferase
MSNVQDRQSFLGPTLDDMLASTTVGVVGLSGGGSHIVQQLAHIGFDDYFICDPDVIDETNLHRLVGATTEDVQARRPKTDIASRVINGLRPRARVESIRALWQDAADNVRRCDVLFGCVDSFEGRRDLEAMARRFMIPLVDIGMDVSTQLDGTARMYGQVFLSMPGGLCMRCVGLLRDRERPDYGDAGGRPQVIWANGILASSAVACVVNLLTGWAVPKGPLLYLSYDGNDGTLKPHPRVEFLLDRQCSHFLSADIGTPRGVPC